jgi:putative membrane protein
MLPAQAWAHEGADHVTPEHIWSAWSFEPVVVLALTISGVLYLSGLLRMKQRPSGMQILSFAAGWLAMMLTLLSPIHRLGSELFSAHMAQHELLMLIAAPLLVLGRLGVVMLWALPIEIRGRLGAWAKARPVAASWAAISAPAAAWLIHGATLWLWHLPALYQATLESEWVHAAQHSTFLFTALLFWWTLIHGRGGRMSYGAAVAYIFTTAVHTSVLGALLTCSSQLWYPIYDGRTMAFGLTALQDQQLGGLIMWVPAGLVYIAIGLWLFAGWLRESEKRLVYSRSAELARLSSATGGRDA